MSGMPSDLPVLTSSTGACHLLSRGFLTMFQVVTNAQWADHVGRPVVFKYPGLAARRAKQELPP